MKLIVKNGSGLTLLRPSKRHLKLSFRGPELLVWQHVVEKASARQNYASEVSIAPGTHEVERIENPLVPGGEPWLVLKGSRVGAAESYLKRLAAATSGTSNAIELVPTPLTTVRIGQPAQSTAA